MQVLILNEFRGVMDDNVPSPPGLQAQSAWLVLIVKEIRGVMDDYSTIRAVIFGLIILK